VSVLEEILRVATRDVDATVRWLLSEGAVVTWEDTPHGMAVAGLEFSVHGASVRMVRDRGQWMMDVRHGEGPWLDLELLRLARRGSDSYPMAPTKASSLPVQLPEGVSWRDELPDLLVWLGSARDAVDLCAALGRSRATRLFPPERAAGE
jgi:hypothetical protein